MKERRKSWEPWVISLVGGASLYLKTRWGTKQHWHLIPQVNSRLVDVPLCLPEHQEKRTWEIRQGGAAWDLQGGGRNPFCSLAGQIHLDRSSVTSLCRRRRDMRNTRVSYWSFFFFASSSSLPPSYWEHPLFGVLHSSQRDEDTAKNWPSNIVQKVRTMNPTTAEAGSHPTHFPPSQRRWNMPHPVRLLTTSSSKEERCLDFFWCYNLLAANHRSTRMERRQRRVKPKQKITF